MSLPPLLQKHLLHIQTQLKYLGEAFVSNNYKQAAEYSRKVCTLVASIPQGHDFRQPLLKKAHGLQKEAFRNYIINLLEYAQNGLRDHGDLGDIVDDLGLALEYAQEINLRGVKRNIQDVLRVIPQRYGLELEVVSS